MSDISISKNMSGKRCLTNERVISTPRCNIPGASLSNAVTTVNHKFEEHGYCPEALLGAAGSTVGGSTDGRKWLAMCDGLRGSRKRNHSA